METNFHSSNFSLKKWVQIVEAEVQRGNPLGRVERIIDIMVVDQMQISSEKKKKRK